MLKKIIASTVAAGVLTVSTVAAAAPTAFESANRTASPIGDTEGLGEGVSEIWIAIIFALIAAGIIVLIEDNEGDVADLPASP